jgi:hypothetical protein
VGDGGSMKEFTPELGQFVFGQPSKQYECPEYLTALLRGIDSELDRVMWNNHQTEYSSPFSNTGNGFKNDTFEVQAYSWSDEEEQPYNFKWRDFEISWYKYCGRGMSINREIMPVEAVQMYDDCIASIQAMEKRPF